MASDLQQTLQRISRKAETLVDRYNFVDEQRRKAEERVTELEATVAQLTEEISGLQDRIEYLTVVTTTFPQRENVEKSRALISRLVREIDKCITDLSE